MKRLAAMSIALALTGSFAATAQTPGEFSGTHCGPRHDIVSALGQLFQESPAALGIVNPHAVIEVFVSERGTWTILASGTDGRSCVVSSGEGWETTILPPGADA